MAVVCAALLAGCGASLTSPDLIGPDHTGMTSALGSAAEGEAKFGIGTSEQPVRVAAAAATPVAAPTLPAGDPARVAAAKAATGFIATSAPGNTAYKIGPHDVLEVAVFQVPELSKTAQVSDVGSISMPLLGEVPASGKTAQELERDLARRLGVKYLQKPQVSVMVKEYNSQRITLEGAVKKPGVYPLRGKTSLLQTIAQAEGFADTADTTVVVFRQTDKGRAAARFARRGAAL